MNPCAFFLPVGAAAVLLGALSGCVTKAGPAEPAGFVPFEMVRWAEDVPFNADCFHKAWLRQGENLARFSAIYIAPVNTDYIRKMKWWQELGGGGQVEEDIQELAAFTQETLEDAFRYDPRGRFQVAARPGPGVLNLEFALVEAVPNKAVLEALSYATGPAGRLASMAASSVMRRSSRSTVAFEARIRDGETGETLGFFMDREAEKTALLSVKGLTAYGQIKDVIKEWADQFVNVLGGTRGEVVKDSFKDSFKDSSSFQRKLW